MRRPSVSPVTHVAPHELFVDDRLRRRRRVAEADEVRSGAQRNVHRLEVAGRHDVRERPILRAVRSRAAFERERAQRQAVNVERDRRRNRRRFDVGHGVELGEQPLGERPRAGRVEAAAGEIVGGEQHAFAREARVRRLSLAEAPEKDSGHHEHGHRQRDLHAHQHLAHAAARRHGGSRAQHLLRIDPRQLRGGRGAERDGAEHRQADGKGQAHRVDAGLEANGKRRGKDRHRAEGLRSPHGNDDPDAGGGNAPASGFPPTAGAPRAMSRRRAPAARRSPAAARSRARARDSPCCRTRRAGAAA